MRALWSDRQNCSHNVSQKVKSIKRVSERRDLYHPVRDPIFMTPEAFVMSGVSVDALNRCSGIIPTLFLTCLIGHHLANQWTYLENPNLLNYKEVRPFLLGDKSIWSFPHRVFP